MNRPIYIIGAGGHTSVLLEALLQEQSIRISGVLEINATLIGSTILNVPVFSQEEILKKYSANDIFLVNGIGSIDAPTLRAKQYEALKLRGYSFKEVVHPIAYYSKNVILGEGVQLLARSVVLTGTRIGCNTIVNTAASVDHDCRIRHHAHISPGAILSGGVEIGDCCHIGTGAIFIQGVKIGANSVIAAGTVVIKNVLAGSRVAGVPAKNITKD